MTKSHKFAVLLMIASATINSTSGLIVRSLDSASEWQIVFWRGFSLTITIAIILAMQYRKTTVEEYFRMGLSGVVAGLFYGGTIIGFTLALTLTNVANAVFIMSAIPFFTVVISWLVLGEKPNAVTLLAIFVAVSGIALMFSDGMASGSMLGNLMAVIAAICFATFVVIARRNRTTNLLPSMVIGALSSALVAAWFLEGKIIVSFGDLFLCVLWGAVISAISHYIVLFCTRYLSGAELTLIILLEFTLAPVWVWMLVNEIPGRMTVVGGVVVLIAVISHAIYSSRRPNPRFL